ncbi:MAG: hypothetical protein B6I31_00215 [Desulfobacteraceae bacterium 4572_19]|nr:MAG: hypothetical protein B6I31_00215 [Desulfobacteraceae bacterium 4572_19]
MTKFRYEAIDLQGKKFIDEKDAVDKDELLLGLQSNGIVLVKWLGGEKSKVPFFSASKQKLKSKELLQLTKDLAHLLKSGLPMDRSLAIVESSAHENSVRDMAGYLKGAIREGSSLSDALSEKPEDFNDLYVNMVRVGEVGGALPQVMEKLASFMERTEEIKSFIISSSIYPIILSLVGVGSILIILGFVVPSFAGVFQDLGQEIPFSTKVLMAISNFLRSWWWLMAVLIFGIIVSAWSFFKTASGKIIMDKWLLKFPMIGTLLMEIQVSRFARTMGTLIESGVPLIRALAIVKNVVGNSVVKEAVNHIYDQVKEGNQISSLMKERDIFPPMAVQMVALGEETGRIGDMFSAVADELDSRNQKKIKSYLALLEPVSILFMGIVIGGIVLSMLSTIFGINDIAF